MVFSRAAAEQEHHDLFESDNERVLAAFDAGVTRLAQVVVDAAATEHTWHERVRAGLSALLLFFDEEPSRARLLLAEPPVAAAAVSERRQQALARLARILAREVQTNGSYSEWFVPSSGLMAELIVGGVFSVLRAQIIEGAGRPFVELTPALMAFIVARCPEAGGPSSGQADAASHPNPGFQRLPVRTTYRTTRVLSAIGASPGLSNRAVAEAAGLTDEGQTSKLLRRLERRALVQNVGVGQVFGGANAWLLTPYGEHVLDATRHSLVPGAGAATSRRIRGAA